MFIKNWKRDVFTIPNLLSLFRLLLIPVYVVIYLNAREPMEYFLAGAILAVSCLTDMIDGKIARHFNMVSTLGKILDPIADKATQFTLTLCLSIKYPVLHYILVLFVVKECFQGIAAFVFYRKGKMLPGALFAGKICTTVLFISLILLVLMPDLDPKIVNSLAIVNAAFLIYAFIAYILAYFGKDPQLQDMEKE